ncbi:DUF2007-related protein [Bacteroides sp. 519]|uniref:DUF2007-related protein n=1 Tax=Bacteroides sp. 519 TaxID=2302937 RepID=UPI0013D21BE1|nr:DUF2007-related protein [Bacteroides sp. 519]NDV57166.1 DUF2007 domain-containing protein [Bacteroides sp. 519]
MKNRNEELLIDVFAGSPWEAELIKGLLESNGIPSSLKDGLMATMAPYNDEVVVQVNEENYETAMEVVRSRSKD